MTTNKNVALYFRAVGGEKIFGASEGFGGEGKKEGAPHGYGHVHRSALSVLVPGITLHLNGTFPASGSVVIEKLVHVDFNDGHVNSLSIDVRYLP